jgi:hypothetical protein
MLTTSPSLIDVKDLRAVNQTRWFYFWCEHCGRSSDTDGFLLDGDYGDCCPCLDVRTKATLKSH